MIEDIDARRLSKAQARLDLLVRRLRAYLDSPTMQLRKAIEDLEEGRPIDARGRALLIAELRDEYPRKAPLDMPSSTSQAAALANLLSWLSGESLRSWTARIADAPVGSRRAESVRRAAVRLRARTGKLGQKQP